MDGQTDGRTELLYQYRASVCWRAIKIEGVLFCCLRHNVETSCHKHFVVSRHQQTPPLTTSGKCHNLPRSGGVVLTAPSRSQRWQYVMKPGESWFLPTPPAFDAPVRGVPVGILSCGLVRKKLEWFGYPTVKNFEDMFISFDRIHERDGRTDGHRIMA